MCACACVCVCVCVRVRVCVCVQAGPPFACGTFFDGVDDTIDLGTWSPGPVYTLATWVSPAITDTRQRVGIRLYLFDVTFHHNVTNVPV